ncbi:c-type cytochrome [Methylocella tundrae]|uniref:Cytochrome c class I n=1 Tax=Methylocella tundrae TaxID=227605 RepID=A0A4U8YWB7_METTU|nr:c-type cytochrome [Methylocella tundrae]WPP05274.1 c-type cytochrome [Methylocella tundrae]VFU07623.1 Cytochrome c class I [Methylocella tundrae]
MTTPLARYGLAIVALIALASPQQSRAQTSPSGAVWSIPDIDALPDDAHGQNVRFGRRLVTQTYALIGPLTADPARRFAGNNLACGDCHLEAGTKKFGAPLFGLFDAFPRYSARRGLKISIEERLNACMTRSMNGRPLPGESPEMQALVAYVKFLSSGLARADTLAGHGSGDMPELDRAADPKRGAAVYARVCAGCHRSDGAGLPMDPEALNLGYAAPPLWGDDSFNDGAGMARISSLANFAHSNMPPGADYLNPRLPVEDAWDVAAYVESQPRPRKAGLDHDFPDLLDKPVDAPYGPYADGFSAAQHKYGPFAPIRAAIARLKADEEATGKAP